MNDNNKTLKKVCRCENCGNEAEMNVVCTYEDFERKERQKMEARKKDGDSHRVKGTATCSHCGNEADMWLDL